MNKSSWFLLRPGFEQMPACIWWLTLLLRVVRRRIFRTFLGAGRSVYDNTWTETFDSLADNICVIHNLQEKHWRLFFLVVKERTGCCEHGRCILQIASCMEFGLRNVMSWALLESDVCNQVDGDSNKPSLGTFVLLTSTSQLHCDVFIKQALVMPTMPTLQHHGTWTRRGLQSFCKALQTFPPLQELFGWPRLRYWRFGCRWVRARIAGYATPCWDSMLVFSHFSQAPRRKKYMPLTPLCAPWKVPDSKMRVFHRHKLVRLFSITVWAFFTQGLLIRIVGSVDP